MHHIVYTSTAVQPITEVDLEDILLGCRRNNERHQVTGLLLYSDEASGFMQVLEGKKEVLHNLYTRIERDCRHRNLVKLADGPSQQRNFSTWSMGFKRVSGGVFTQLAGYVEPQSPAFAQALAGTHDELIRQMLELFASEQTAAMYV